MIKFRAWDNENGFYLYNIQDAYDTMGGFVKYDDGEDADYDEDCFGSFLDNKRYVVEQFTGLKDMNGKNIYVGDIVQPVSSYVRLKRDKPFEVKKDNYVYSRWIANYVSSKELGRFYFSNEIQTVGNVHVNKDLLNGDN